MPRAIVGFHLDDEGQWAADLACLRPRPARPPQAAVCRAAVGYDGDRPASQARIAPAVQALRGRATIRRRRPKRRILTREIDGYRVAAADENANSLALGWHIPATQTCSSLPGPTFCRYALHRRTAVNQRSTMAAAARSASWKEACRNLLVSTHTLRDRMIPASMTATTLTAGGGSCRTGSDGNGRCGRNRRKDESRGDQPRTQIIVDAGDVP